MADDASYKGFKLTDDRLERILELIKLGNYLATAAAATGIGERSLFRWLQRGEELNAHVERLYGEDHDYDEHTPKIPDQLGLEGHHQNDWMCWRLWHGQRKAEAEAEAFAVAIVRKHMPDQWTAAMTFLERRHPRRWKRRDLHEVAAVEAEERRGGDQGLLENAEAQRALHDALARAAGELPAGDVEPGE